METITIAKQEYEELLGKAAKVDIIEDVMHQPELSEEIIQELRRARHLPDSQLVSTAEMKRKHGV